MWWNPYSSKIKDDKETMWATAAIPTAEGSVSVKATPPIFPPWKSRGHWDREEEGAGRCCRLTGGRDLMPHLSGIRNSSSWGPPWVSLLWGLPRFFFFLLRITVPRASILNTDGTSTFENVTFRDSLWSFMKFISFWQGFFSADFKNDTA